MLLFVPVLLKNFARRENLFWDLNENEMFKKTDLT